MDNNIISNILIIVLMCMISVLIILSIVYVVLRLKIFGKNNTNKTHNKEKTKKVSNKSTAKASDKYSKQSIFDFMEFDKVEDNMIIQKEGKKYLMVVECQGINYDLMSNMEKIAVEEGFQQFLNTLRHPIQIYIQTRTINLENSIRTYQKKVKEIENKYNDMEYEYNKAVDSGKYTEEQLDKYLYEMTKQKNLLEYGKDIVRNTENMSLNKNILNKKYYIVIPYYYEELNNNKYDKAEIRNMAFSELYVKAQSIIRTISACSVSGRILSSEELIDLLYVAYNRDESEIFGIDKAIKAEYESMYSIAPDVLEKKLVALNRKVEDRAIELANEKIQRIKTEKEMEIEETEENIDELISQMAELIITENEQYIGEDIAKQAVEEIKQEREGGKNNDGKKKKSTRGRKKKTEQ